MKNYYEFDKLNYDIESINYFKSIPKLYLKAILNDNLNNIDYYLNYLSKLLKDIFNGYDYDEHYYLLKSLSESINDIKIILNILKGDNDD